MPKPEHTDLIGRANLIIAACTFDPEIEVYEDDWELLTDADYTLYQWMHS